MSSVETPLKIFLLSVCFIVLRLYPCLIRRDTDKVALAVRRKLSQNCESYHIIAAAFDRTDKEWKMLYIFRIMQS